jgi:hypothetical protein
LTTRSSRLGVAALAFVLALAASPWQFPTGADGTAMLATSTSLYEHRSIAVDARFARDDAYSPSGKEGPDGRVYVKYGVGLPLVELPFLAISRAGAALLGQDDAAVKSVALSVVNPLLMALAVFALIGACETAGISPGAARAAALTFFVTTPAWVYAIYDNSEALQTAAIAGSYWALVSFARTGRSTPLWLTGAALGFAILTKSTVLLMVPPFAFGVWQASRARGLAVGTAAASAAPFALPVGIAAVVAAGANWWRYGSALDGGYNTPIFTERLMRGVYGLVVSPNKGIVFYAPLVLLAPYGLFRLFRRRAHADALAVALALAVWIAGHAKFYDWGGGWTWGPRYLMPILPLAFVAVAEALDRSARARLAAYPLAAAGLVVTLLGVVVDEGASRRAVGDFWFGGLAGTIRAGQASTGRTVEIARSAEDVLPAFSSIASHWWLLRVALQGCDCTEGSIRCACPAGAMTANRVFQSPPWRKGYPEVEPVPPYDLSILQPRLLRTLYRAAVFDPETEPRRTTRRVPGDR